MPDPNKAGGRGRREMPALIVWTAPALTSPQITNRNLGLTAIMPNLSQLRVRAEELRINNYPRMRKSELETEVQKREQAIAAEGTPQPTNLQRAHTREVT